MSEQQQEIVTKPATSKIGLVFGLCAFLLVGGALGYSFYELSQVNVTLAHMVSDLKQQVASNQTEMMQLREAVTHVKSAASDVTQVKEQNTEANLDKWHVSEALYLTKLADHYMQVMKDPETAATLLQHADDVLQKATGNAVLPLRKALQDNMNALKTAAPVNTEELYAKLMVINDQLDKLPFPVTPLQVDEPVAGSSTKVTTWQAGWQKAKDAFNRIVIIRKIDPATNNIALALPEEKLYLTLNLHAAMQAALLAVVQRNASIYQNSLQLVATNVQKFYLQSSPLTANVLKALQEMQAINLQVPTVNVAATLQLFDQYLAANNQ